MKRVNVILALVFVSFFGLSSCREDEVNEMIIDQPGTEKMTANDHEHDDDITD